jgi:hypothetical protein
VKRAALLAVAVAAVAAAPAQAEVFVAYGEGVTLCTIDVLHSSHGGNIWTGGEPEMSFHGEVACNEPVEQTGHAWVPADLNWPAYDGGFCAGFTTRCYSGQEDIRTQNSMPMTYELTLRAPLGQGWLGAPRNCTGVGTDNLRCVFKTGESWAQF